MSEFAVSCECGSVLKVSAADAGSSLSCKCGRQVAVPSFGELRKLQGNDGPAFQPSSPYIRTVNQHREATASSPTAWIVFGVVYALLLAAILIGQMPVLGALAFIAMFYGGKFWFLGVMLSEMGVRALLVFLIPFFDWAFLVIRFDVAWRPVLIQMLAFGPLMATAAVSGS